MLICNILLLIFSFSELIWVVIIIISVDLVNQFSVHVPSAVVFLFCDILPQLVWVNTQTF